MFLADKEESAYAMSRMDQTQMHLSSYVEAALDQKMNAMQSCSNFASLHSSQKHTGAKHIDV